MLTRKSKGIFFTLLVSLSLGLLAARMNWLGHVAYAVEKAVITAVDHQLPTEDEVAALAEINRLVARKAVPAVVQIVTRTTIPDIEEHEDLLRRRLPNWDNLSESEKQQILEQIRPRGQGSGVIIDAEQGFILTNNHVITEAGDIEVRLHDGRRFDATLIGSDPPTDVAVIKIDADQLFALPLGDSRNLQVGDPVMTVGNPFGFDGTVSKGIVSAKGRITPVPILDYEGFIQTDAVINPGNSGGPLVNMRAEVVGINTAIETRTGAFNGIGLAIPASRVERVLPALLRGEKVVRGYLGVEMTPMLGIEDNPQLRNKPEELAWNQPVGVLVTRVVEMSPADEAGIKKDDILVNMNGSEVISTTELSEKIAWTPPGETVILDIWRDKKMVSIQVVVGHQPEGFSTRADRNRNIDAPEPTSGSNTARELGLEVATLDYGLRQRFKLRGVVSKGVVVTDVRQDSEAFKNQVEAGDVIVAVNGNSVNDTEELFGWLEESSDLNKVDLRLRNQQGSRHVKLKFDKRY